MKEAGLPNISPNGTTILNPACGSIPLIVLTREQGGFHDLDIPAAQQETERRANQSRLVSLSTNSVQRTVASGEDMQIEAPVAVVEAAEDVLKVVRNNAKLQK